MNTNYVLYAPRVNIGGVLNVELQSQDVYTKEITYQQNGIFDSTSKYIWFGDSSLLEKIVQSINNITQSHCTLKNMTVYTCATVVDRFPDLTFTLTDYQ